MHTEHSLKLSSSFHIHYISIKVTTVRDRNSSRGKYSIVNEYLWNEPCSPGSHWTSMSQPSSPLPIGDHSSAPLSDSLRSGALINSRGIVRPWSRLVLRRMLITYEYACPMEKGRTFDPSILKWRCSMNSIDDDFEPFWEFFFFSRRWKRWKNHRKLI